MPVCAIVIHERGRRCLGNTLLLLNLVVAMMGILLVCSGMYLAFLFYQRKDLLKGYDYKKITKFVMGMGTALSLFHLLGAKICFDCGNHKTRERFQGFLIIYILGLFVAMAAIIAMTISCSSHSSQVAQGFERVFLELMDNYGTDMEKKHELDMIQIRHRCCGSGDYSDWTKIEWYSSEYIRPEVLKNAPKNTDRDSLPRGVPFTCCDPGKMGPCVHDVVDTPRPGYKATEGKFFYTKGCGEAITGDIQSFLTSVSLWALFPFWFELVIAIFTKYLYTSINNAIERGDPKGPGHGYMMEKCPITACEFCECDIQGNKSKRRKSEDSASEDSD